MNRKEFNAFKKEKNPFRPSIDYGTKEEHAAWNMGADALFNYIERQNKEIDEDRLDRIIMRKLQDRIKASNISKELTDSIIDQMVDKCIDEYYKEKK